jgi:L-iditol 2-dehydrogenase
MKGTMKAWYYESANNAVLKDLPIPEISDGEVLVKVKAIGICHTDLMVLSGINIVPVPFPFIGGHEWAGEVVEIGKDVVTVKPGDRVVGEGNSGCGSCLICKEGHEDYCMVAPVQRGINTDGSFAEYYRIIPRLLYKIPDSMDWITASLIEPFTVAYNGIARNGGCDPSDVVVIQGGGGIGLSAVAVAKAMGACVILSNRGAYRREMGLRLGADIVVDPSSEDLQQIILDRTDGFGADLVVETTGNMEATKQAFDLVRNNGRISCLGANVGTEIPFEIGKIMMKGLRVQGLLGSAGIWGKAIKFIEQSKLDLKMLSTHTFPLTEAEAAFKFASNTRDNDFVKVTLLTE